MIFMVHARELYVLLAVAVNTATELFVCLLSLFCWMPCFSSIFSFLAIFGFKYSRLPGGFVADRREVSQRPATLPQAGLLPREQEYVHRRTSATVGRMFCLSGTSGSGGIVHPRSLRCLTNGHV